MTCPICKKPVPNEGLNRPKTYPFCSERCKLIDLGRWLDGKYQIPVADRDEPAAADDDDKPRRPSDN